MARLVGVDLPREKRVEIALTYIFGIGLTRAHATLAATGVNPDTRVKDLQEPELAKLREFIEANYKIEGDLRREVAGDIRRKVEIQSYQGTHTNARTRKGPRKAIAGKKKETK
jgi:small subunit ribosomal protein S13